MALQTGPYTVFYDTVHMIQLRFTCVQATVTPTYVQVLNTTCEYTNLSSSTYYNFGVTYTTNAAPLNVNPSKFSLDQLAPMVPVTSFMTITNNNYNPSTYTPAIAFAFMWSYDPNKNTPDQYFGAYTNQIPFKSGGCPGPNGSVQTCGISAPTGSSLRVATYLKPKVLKKGFIDGPVSGFWDLSDLDNPLIYAPSADITQVDEQQEEEDAVLVTNTKKLTLKK